MMLPILLIPAFLPRQAYARTQVQTRQTVEVWPANHHREEALVVSTSNNNNQSAIFRDAFEGDIPLQHSTAQHHSPVQHHVAPQHHSGFEADTPRHHSTPTPQTQHSVADSSNTRVAGALKVFLAQDHECAVVCMLLISIAACVLQPKFRDLRHDW